MKKWVGFAVVIGLGALMFYDIKLFLVAFPVLLIGFIIFSFAFIKKMQQTGISTDAQRLETTSEESPVYKYKTLQGETVKGSAFIRVYNKTGIRESRLQQEIIYDPQKPEVFIVPDDLPYIKNIFRLGIALSLLSLAIGVSLLMNVF